MCVRGQREMPECVYAVGNKPDLVKAALNLGEAPAAGVVLLASDPGGCVAAKPNAANGSDAPC